MADEPLPESPSLNADTLPDNPAPTPTCQRINLNDLATAVTLREGGAVKLDISDVKEVILLTLQELSKASASQGEDAILSLVRSSMGRSGVNHG